MIYTTYTIYTQFTSQYQTLVQITYSLLKPTRHDRAAPPGVSRSLLLVLLL